MREFSLSTASTLARVLAGPGREYEVRHIPGRKLYGVYNVTHGHWQEFDRLPAQLYAEQILDAVEHAACGGLTAGELIQELEQILHTKFSTFIDDGEI